MGLFDAIKVLNGLKRRRVLRDYMVVGAAALVIWDEPVETQDLDVAILVDSDLEYAKAWGALYKESGALWGMDKWGIMVEGVPVQMVTVDISPAYLDAFQHAVVRRIGNLRVKVATREHLAVMKALAFRPRDRGHIGMMMERGLDRRRLREILARVDADGKATKNLAQISAGTYP